MFDAALAAVLPAMYLQQHLPEPPAGRTIVVGTGQAALAMAEVLGTHRRGPLSGIVLTRHGHAVPCDHIEVIAAPHPVPDAAGRAAPERMLEAVRSRRTISPSI